MLFSGLLRRLWPYLAIAGLLVLLWLTMRRVASLEAALANQVETLRRQQEVNDAANSFPRGRDAVADRMREGEF